jgi:hypothetical protein
MSNRKEYRAIGMNGTREMYVRKVCMNEGLTFTESRASARVFESIAEAERVCGKWQQVRATPFDRPLSKAERREMDRHTQAELFS